MKPNEREKGKITVTCARGVAPLLKEELQVLGFPVLFDGISSIETEGTFDDTMKLNLFLRTGHRVLYLLGKLRARTPEDLYEGISTIAWEDILFADRYLSVTSSVDTPMIRDSRFANVKCKDAIVDRMLKRCGQRPNSGPDRSGAVVHLYWKEARCLVYLDTTGEPLSRRGYRRVSVEAPMQETLAAAVVLSTGWKGDENFINPMCGSGTLAIEAALIGLGRAPGLLRTHFAFMDLKGYDEHRWAKLRSEARKRSRRSMKGRIIATDIRPEAIERAKKNASTAGVQQLIEFGVCNYSDTPLPPNGGVIVLNPPYGERLGDQSELERLYKGIGDYFKNKGKGYRGYLFTGNLGLAKRVGLRTKRRLIYYNGEIECRLLEYELYEGSRKQQRTTDNRLWIANS